MIFLGRRIYVGMVVKVDHRDVVIVEFLKNQLSMFCLSVFYNSRRQSFGYIKQVLPEALNAFVCWTVLIKFCLGEMKGTLVNDECNWWYSRIHVSDFSMSVWDI